MNIVRVSPKECLLKLSLNDSNIKIKTHYINGRELNKNDLSKLDKDIYVEWRIQPPKYSNFFASLLYCARNGLFEKESVEYFKNILDIQEPISTKQNFLRENFVNNRSITDLLNEINDDYLQKNDGFPSSNSQEVGYLFSSRVTSNSREIILSMVFNKKGNILIGFSIFFYSKKENFHKNNEIRLPLDTMLSIVWLNMCKLFLYASKETCEAITPKLEEIKPIIDKIERQRNFIKESFALNLEECHISKDIGAENAYTISSISNVEYDKRISINAVENHDIFNQCNLTFEHCIFNDTISMAMTFTKKIHFSYCTFNQIVSFEDSEFQEKVSFERSTFKNGAIFIAAQFHKGAYFTGSTFEKAALFTETIFKDNAYFDNTTFKDEANFQIGEFHKNAYFYGAIFQKFPIFIQAIFNEDINFTNTELDIEFDEVKNKIKSIYKNRLKEYKKERKGERPQIYKIANELRDSFRTIKSALIKNNNMLDASNYHRVELYCKELELKYKRGLWDIDRIQLMCYRVTSKHHTDLLLILNNIIFLIALFGVSSLALTLCTIDCNFENIIAEVSRIKINEIFIISLFAGLTICFMFGCYKKLVCVIMLIGVCVVIVCACLPPLALVIILMFCIIIFILLVFFACILRCLDKAYMLKIKKYVFWSSYPIVTIMLFFKPSSILPVLGKIIENKTTNYCCVDEFDIFGICLDTPSFASETLNLIYMLFLFLLLWSLQKTARKNTIIPK